jgi:VWFA-related protein
MLRNKKVIIFFMLCLISLQQGISQEEKIRQYKVEVKEKLLYVLALNKNGNPVTELKKGDFELFVNGQPQQIKTFSSISQTSNKINGEKREIPVDKLKLLDTSLKEYNNNKRFILAAIPQRFATLFHLGMTKKSLSHLITQAQYPNDWIGIVIIHNDYISSLQDFTNSKEKLLRKVDAFFRMDKKELAFLEQQYPLTDDEFYQVPQLPIFQGVLHVTGGIDIIPALKLIAEKMAILKGRKIIICLGLPLAFLGPDNRISAFFDMIDKMTSYNITIYYSETRKQHIRTYEDFIHESSHFALANETGGKYYNMSSPTYFIDDVNKMNSSYYLISFPITLQLEKKESFKIRLKCKRKGVKLYYSNKYYAPHEFEERKFEETYKKIQLFKYLVVDTEQPKLNIEGKWIALPGEEETLQVGFIDFYLPPELFQQIPQTYQLGGSYATSQRKGIFFQSEVECSSPQKDKGYRARALVKFTREGKSLRLVAMDSESGEYGRLDIDINESSEKTDFSDILLGKLADKKRTHEFREYSEARYNLKKELYNLLSVNDQVIIPSVNNAFSAGENITFCLIHKIPEEQAKRYKNVKAVAYLSLDKEGQITEITLPVRSKKVEKHYRQYYGTIDTSSLRPGNYRIEIDLKDANNSIITATDAYLKLIK